MVTIIMAINKSFNMASAAFIVDVSALIIEPRKRESQGGTSEKGGH